MLKNMVACFLSFSWFCYHTPLQSEPFLSCISIVSILLNFDYIPRRVSSVGSPDPHGAMLLLFLQLSSFPALSVRAEALHESAPPLKVPTWPSLEYMFVALNLNSLVHTALLLSCLNVHIPLVFHRDWWKQKPKLFPWRTHPSFQRVPYRKGTGYGSATWSPKSQSKSELF